MKKLYTYLGVLACFLMTTMAYSQEVIIVEDFDDGVIPTGWNTLGFLPTEEDACENGSLRRNFKEDGAQSGSLSTPGFEASGSDIIVSFDYKIVDVGTGDVPTGDFGTMDLQYSVDGGTTWTTYTTIDSTSPDLSSDCTTHSDTILAVDVPAGSEFAWKLNGTWLEGDYYFYIDNFSAIEQVDCIQPIMITVDEESITMDSAEISWDELGGATSWVITYSLIPNLSFGGTEVCVTTNPYTLTGLTDGLEYFVWVQADCDVDCAGDSTIDPVSPDTSFNTVAIGSDCENPLEVTALPYTHADQDTGDYGDDYEGAAGISCGATGDYLSGFETVYHFVPATDDILQINLSDLSVGFSGVFVYTSCDDIGNEAAACFGASTSDTTDDHGIEDLFVTAGEDYYIVVSSFPGAGADETLEYTLDIIGFDCATFETPIADTPQTYVTGQTLFDLDVDPTIEGAIFTWYSDAALTTEIPNTTVLVNGTTYYVTQTIGVCESAATAVTVEEFDCLTGLDIISTTEGPGACDSGTVDLEATANINENIYWWDAETEGNIVAIGPNFTTPELDVTTSYWVSEAFLGEGTVAGQASPGPVALETYGYSDYGVAFELDAEITLVDLTVYNTGAAGALILQISPSDGSAPITITQALPAGTEDSPTPVIINIDEELPAGSYTMTQISELDIAYDSDASFPYPIGVSGEVTHGITSYSTSTSSYYYFYDWTIIEDRPLCESPREEVVATVHEIIPIELSVVDPTVCIGSSTELTVTTTNDDYEFELTWNNGSESDTNFDYSTNTITVTPDENTTYTVIATDTVTGCMTENEIFVEVIGVPAEFPMAPGETTIVCAGESTMLVAGGIGENFEGTTEWTTQNNSASDDDPEAAAWSIQQSPYLGAGIVSNDNSQFYFSHADILGAGGTVDAELTSPSFSLVSVDEASISFEHYYRHHPSTIADVEISLDGGATWDNNLASYTSTQGAADAFKVVKIDLEEYLGHADVQIRFRYHGGWGWWWAVDNVTIIRDYIGEVTWSPQTDLFLDPQATIAYDGTGDAPTVYYNAAEAGTTTYTATLEVADCGSTVGTIEITAQFTGAPIAETGQTFNEGALISDIVATGENLIWYADETGQLIIPETTILEDGVTYYVSQTVNGCESVLVPVTVTVVSASENCPEPIAINIDDVTYESALISWDEPEDPEDAVEIYYYRVKKIVEGEDPVVVFQGEILLGTGIIDITGLEPVTDYTFEMFSVCDEENAVYSDLSGPEPFTTEPLGIDKVNFRNLDYYPNPTSDILTISNNISIDRVEVYDISGKRILDKKAGMFQLKIDFSEFSSGMYLAKITADGATEIIRIIKK